MAAREDALVDAIRDLWDRRMLHPFLPWLGGKVIAIQMSESGERLQEQAR